MIDNYELKRQILTLQGMFLSLQARVEALEKEKTLDAQIADLEKMIKERNDNSL